MHLLGKPRDRSSQGEPPFKVWSWLATHPGDGPQPSPNASSRKPAGKPLRRDFTGLCWPQGPWEMKPARGRPAAQPLLLPVMNRTLLCVPEEMAHISLPLVLLAAQLFAPIHLPPEATGRGNEEGELIREGRKPGPRVRVEPKGIRDLGVSVGPPEPGGSQSLMCLQTCIQNSYVHQSNLVQSKCLLAGRQGALVRAAKTEHHRLGGS